MTPVFSVYIEQEAFDDIQNAINFYNSRKEGLGKQFFNTINRHFLVLRKNYLSFSIKYDNIRCMRVKKFPYMIHYRIIKTEHKINITAVFCTHSDPGKLTTRRP